MKVLDARFVYKYALTRWKETTLVTAVFVDEVGGRPYRFQRRHHATQGYAGSVGSDEARSLYLPHRPRSDSDAVHLAFPAKAGRMAHGIGRPKNPPNQNLPGDPDC